MAAIAKYKVGVGRGAHPGPVRWISVQLAKPEAGVRQVSLFFYEHAPPSLGYVNMATGIVVANLPLGDFDPTYLILNTEQPVFVYWRTDPEEDRLIGIDISTSDESPGEGTPDISP